MTDPDRDSRVADWSSPAAPGAPTRDSSDRLGAVESHEGPVSPVAYRGGRPGRFPQDARIREVEEQRNQIAAVFRLSEILQSVDQAVIRQSSRTDIDRLVCELLVESGEYAAAWIGDVDLARELIVPRAVAGVPVEVIEPVPFDADDDADPPDSATAAAATGVARDARVWLESDDQLVFPAFARDRGCRSMTAVPLAFRDLRYGVLTLFSARENAFEDYEWRVLEQLGRTVGHAINAIDRKQALVGDRLTQIEIRLPGAAGSLDRSGGPGPDDNGIEVERTVLAGDDRIVQYLAVSGRSPERFQEALAGVAGVEAVREIGGVTDGHRFEVVYADLAITSTIATYGGRVESVRFDVPDLCFTIAFPRDVDVQRLVRSFRSQVPGLELLARRAVTPDTTGTESYHDEIEDALTERQRTALTAAYFAGYFEWSRDTTGEEVAETLGVSPSTFHQHLRAAQRKVISTLFDDERSA